MPRRCWPSSQTQKSFLRGPWPPAFAWSYRHHNQHPKLKSPVESESASSPSLPRWNEYYSSATERAYRSTGKVCGLGSGRKRRRHLTARNTESELWSDLLEGAVSASDLNSCPWRYRHERQTTMVGSVQFPSKASAIRALRHKTEPATNTAPPRDTRCRNG